MLPPCFLYAYINQRPKGEFTSFYLFSFTYITLFQKNLFSRQKNITLIGAPLFLATRLECIRKHKPSQQFSLALFVSMTIFFAIGVPTRLLVWAWELIAPSISKRFKTLSDSLYSKFSNKRSFLTWSRSFFLKYMHLSLDHEIHLIRNENFL